MLQPDECLRHAANTSGKLDVLTSTTRTLSYGISAYFLPKFLKLLSMTMDQSVTGTAKPPTSNIGNNSSNASLLRDCQFPHVPQIGRRRDDAARVPTPRSTTITRQASRIGTQIRRTHHLFSLPLVGVLPNNHHHKDRHPLLHNITNTGGTLTLSWWDTVSNTRSKS
jgi:hypothetical protein